MQRRRVARAPRGAALAPDGDPLNLSVAELTPGSVLVAAGIFASRIAGLVRERVMATYFGTGLHADVLGAGLRLPNVLQNLLGEGTLSASFIPVYSELLGQGRTKDAGRVAGAMFGLLLAVAGTIALLGILLAPLLVDVFLPGFEGQRRALMIDIVRILFPMTGVLVLSAWALGILNSHRHFFLPYFAPVLWNAAIIGALVAFARRVDLDGLLMAAAWGALAGGLLQFLVQLPAVLRLDREIRIGSGRHLPPFHEALRNAGPAILGRGVVQLSSYIDLFLGSLLAIGAVARLRYAQTLYVLPVSLFGASTAAAEFRELARERSGDHDALRARVVAAVRRVSFLVVPSFVAFVLLGDVLVAGVYRAGAFGAGDVTIVWLTLAAYGFGLLASTTTRVYQSAFFALRDTKTPARVAALRMVGSAIAGFALMAQFEPIALAGLRVPGGMFSHWQIAGAPLGPVGLAVGASLGAWLEWALLHARLAKQIGACGAGAGRLAKSFAAALVATAAGYAAKLALSGLHPLLVAVIVVTAFGAIYFAVARAFQLEEASSMLAALARRARR